MVRKSSRQRIKPSIPSQGYCRKRLSGGLAFTVPREAAQEAKRIYDGSGIKLFAYWCTEYPCREFRMLHLTKQYGESKIYPYKTNQNILNYHAEKERFLKGKRREKRKKWKSRSDRRKRLENIETLSRWEDDGGALYSKHLERNEAP